MKCQQCAKEASFQITEIHGEGNFDEFHFCDECAQKYLYDVAPKKKVEAPEESVAEKGCEHCGTKFVDFRNTGRLGCPHDYSVFRAELLPLLDTIHSASRHAGKTPRHHRPLYAKTVALAQLKQELLKAIAAEAYETAADLRDRIRNLEEV